MDLFYAQSVAGLRVCIALIKTDGTNATGATGLSTIIRTPAGTTLVGTTDYTEATITEIDSTGIYECYFPLAAGTKAFTSIDQDSPYTLILDSTDADIDHSSKDLRIVSVMPWEVSTETTLLAVSGDIQTVNTTTLALSGDIQTSETNITALLTNASYGLSSLKILIDAIDTAIDAIDTSSEMAARFTEIKGAGFTNENLENIKNFVDELETRLTAFRASNLDGAEMGRV